MNTVGGGKDVTWTRRSVQYFSLIQHGGRIDHSNCGEALDFFSAVQQLTLWVLADSRVITEGFSKKSALEGFVFSMVTLSTKMAPCEIAAQIDISIYYPLSNSNKCFGGENPDRKSVV